MSDVQDMGFLRKNWHLLAVFVAVVAAIPVVALREKAQQQNAAQAASQTIDATAALGAKSRIEPVAPRDTPRDAALKIIESHRQRFEANPQSDEAPALLSAMGNLYRQRLTDYGQAASCFERLLTEYPEAANTRDAYLQLVICYDRLGDVENRRRVLRRMMDVYPPESEEHLFAVRELGL
ncbi:MAG: hypothetical protein AMXMBFR82_31210 [Candidatus Hydrogenedentota bacterium]